MISQDKQFTVINDDFICAHCKQEVPATVKGTPRNHCPFCLWCKHLDIRPGDRANPCKGLMTPISVHIHSKKGYMIIHECTVCNERVRVKSITAPEPIPDNFDLILTLSQQPS